jgi:hypothetical protein
MHARVLRFKCKDVQVLGASLCYLLNLRKYISTGVILFLIFLSNIYMLHNLELTVLQYVFMLGPHGHDSTLVGSFLTCIDCERSLLSAGLDFRAGERKGKEGLLTTNQETKYALPTQRKIPIGRNRYACQSNLVISNYAINNFQTEY